MDMKTYAVQLITAFIGSLGFSCLFGMRRRHLLWASLGGVLTWGVYLAVAAWLHEGFFANLAASAFAIVWAEIMARVRKTPATQFVIPAIVPLVPGSSLYYSLASAVRGNLPEAKLYGSQTVQVALAIAAGISFVVALRQLNTKRQ